MAVIVDGKKQDEIPNSPIGQDNKYYDVQVDCTSSKTSGLWDYNAWRLNLDYIESNSKCNLLFTSTLSKEDYDKYIQAGVALRRNTYRGKDITKYYTGDEKVNNRDLFQQISNCTFDDIYVGDYIKTSNNGHDITWLIADLNNYLLTGANSLKDCHATIIPAKNILESQFMNDTNVTGVVDPDLKLKSIAGSEITDVGGYMGSNMKQKILPQILSDYVEPIFNNHVMSHQNILSDKVENGVPSRFTWYNTKLDLMSEVSVFGAAFVSLHPINIGVDKQQYAIFKLKPEFINSYDSAPFHSWLRTINPSGQGFAAVTYEGIITSYGSANPAIGVRPYFLID